MATTHTTANRRVFLKTSLAGALIAGTARLSGVASAAEENRNKSPSRVALTAGNDRAANTFQGLVAFQH